MGSSSIIHPGLAEDCRLTMLNSSPGGFWASTLYPELVLLLKLIPGYKAKHNISWFFNWKNFVLKEPDKHNYTLFPVLQKQQKCDNKAILTSLFWAPTSKRSVLASMTAWNILKPLPSEATKRALGELLYDPRVVLKFERNCSYQI